MAVGSVYISYVSVIGTLTFIIQSGGIDVPRFNSADRVSRLVDAMLDDMEDDEIRQELFECFYDQLKVLPEGDFMEQYEEYFPAEVDEFVEDTYDV